MTDPRNDALKLATAIVEAHDEGAGYAVSEDGVLVLAKAVIAPSTSAPQSEMGRSERDDALDAADRAISELANRYMNTVEDYYCHGLWRAREAIAILKRPAGNEEKQR